MKNFQNACIAFVKNADLLFLFYYIIAIHLLIIQRNNPIVASSTITNALLIFIGTSASVLAGAYFFLKNREKKINEKLIPFEKDGFAFFLNLLSFVSGIIILISIGYGLYEYKEIASTESFALRAISTSLHPLVPLESRWIFLLGPWIFLQEPNDRKTMILRCLNIAIWIILIFLTQTKLNFLFLLACSVLLIIKNFMGNFSWSKLIAYSFLIFLSTKGVNSLLFNSEHALQVTLQNKKVESTKIINNSALTPKAEACFPFPINQNHHAETIVSKEAPFSLEHIYTSLQYRIFGTATKVSNVFFCLRDSGHWSPNFRGHQLARLLGVHLPVYRWAMDYVDPTYGATAATSAVANFVSDSYLNLGYFGIFLATLFAMVGWLFLKLISSDKGYLNLYFYYLRLLFVFILISQSFISAIVIILFLVLLLSCYKIYNQIFLAEK